MNKVVSNFSEAVSNIYEGASIMVMSFAGPAGIPQNLIKGLLEKKVKNLTLIATGNICYVGRSRLHPDFKMFVAPKELIQNQQVRKLVVAWGQGAEEPGGVSPLVEHGQELDFEFMPLGVLAHRIRVAGNGIGAFFSPIGAGTWYAEGKETRVIDGKEFILEYPLRADFGLIRAYKADTTGNLMYKGIGRGFNPLIAKACAYTIAEVDEIVSAGQLDPEHIITPGIYVNKIMVSEREVTGI